MAAGTSSTSTTGGGGGGGAEEKGAAGRVIGSTIQEGEGGIKQALKEGKGWKDEDVLAYAKTIGDNHPMFAESLEEMDASMIDAIQAIKFEGKDYKGLAEQAKEHGNSLFKWGKKNPGQYENCLTSYNEAEEHAKKITNEVDEAGKNLLLSQIYGNRAMAHLMLKNYRTCKDDCDKALALAPDNVKVIYRKARACQGLRQDQEAIDLCDRGLALDPANKELKAIRDKCSQSINEVRQREEARETARLSRVKQRRAKLEQAWYLCHDRFLLQKKEEKGDPLLRHQEKQKKQEKGGKSGRPIQIGEAFYAGAAVAENQKQALALPTLDEYATTDFMEAVLEEDMFALVLAQMLPEAGEGPPPPWDREGEYRCSNVEVYFQAKSTEAFKTCDEYVAAVERFYVLVGVGEDDYGGVITRDKAEAQLEKRNVWKDLGEYWVQVHVGCTLMDILHHRDHVVPATLPILHTYARDSQAHHDFLSKNKGRIKTLLPSRAGR